LVKRTPILTTSLPRARGREFDNGDFDNPNLIQILPRICQGASNENTSFEIVFQVWSAQNYGSGHISGSCGSGDSAISIIHQRDVEGKRFRDRHWKTGALAKYNAVPFVANPARVKLVGRVRLSGLYLRQSGNGKWKTAELGYAFLLSNLPLITNEKSSTVLRGFEEV
jgi:hypothetical protein